MDHYHLFSFTLRKGYGIWTYLHCWLRWIFKSIIRYCTEDKTARTDPISSAYAFWNDVYVNWDHTGWTVFHPSWNNRYSNWLQCEIPSRGCYLERSKILSVIPQIKIFFPLTEAIYLAQNSLKWSEGKFQEWFIGKKQQCLLKCLDNYIANLTQVRPHSDLLMSAL